jgi:hypothetical protein
MQKNRINTSVLAVWISGGLLAVSLASCEDAASIAEPAVVTHYPTALEAWVQSGRVTRNSETQMDRASLTRVGGDLIGTLGVRTSGRAHGPRQTTGTRIGPARATAIATVHVRMRRRGAVARTI